MDTLAQSSATTHGAPALLAYETPGTLGRRGVLFRENDLLVIRDGTELPRVCVACGSETGERTIALAFTWDASFHVTHQKSTLALRQSGAILAHLCPRHHRRWMAGRILGVGGMIASGVVMAAGAALAIISESSDVPRWTGAGIETLLAGFALMILFLFVFALRTRTLSCRRIDDRFLTLHGACEGLLTAIQNPRSEEFAA